MGYNVSAFDLIKQLTQAKREIEWLNIPTAQSLQGEILHLDKAYKNFFRNIKKGINKGFPKFKKKSSKQSCGFCQGVKIISNKKVYVPKIGNVNIVMHREFTGVLKTCTISKAPSGKYYISMLSEQPEMTTLNTSENEIGIDLGIKEFAVLSNGARVPNPKFHNKSLKRLKMLSRRLSRKVKGSNNRNKAKLKLARLHERVSNQRNNFLNETVHKITQDVKTVCVEDLQIKNMIKNRKLSRSIADVAWGSFAVKLENKCRDKGIGFIIIDKWNPSSKTCNGCGGIYKGLKLSEREWICETCGSINDRDLNASKNILDAGVLLRKSV